MIEVLRAWVAYGLIALALKIMPDEMAISVARELRRKLHSHGWGILR